MFGHGKSWRSDRERRAQEALARINALAHSGNLDDALLLCQELVTWDPQNYDAWTCLSRTYLNLKRYDESLHACENAVIINSQRAVAWQIKGKVLLQLKRFDEALTAASHLYSRHHDNLWQSL
jgi:tetratricopeptide (TPR) repeat protein